MEKVNILWTGGWDSTFRVLMLRTKEVIIQPYYMRFGRPSEELELKAMKRITQSIESRSETKCIVKPVIQIEKSEIDPADPYYQAFINLKNESHLGTQYILLAKLAESVKSLELGIEKNAGVIEYFLEKYAIFNRVNDDNIGIYYKIDEHKTINKNVLLLFKNFRFPLRDFTKLDMKHISRNEGVLHIMNMTWFCHTPIHNRPCGRCNPCKYTIEEGLKYRIGRQGLIRYHLHRMYNSYKDNNISRSPILKKILGATGLKSLFFSTFYK